MSLPRRTLPKILSLILICSSVFLTGCGATKVVYTDEHDSVRLAEDTKAHVWVKDASGKQVRSSNKVILHDGDYLVHDPEAKPVPK